MVLHKCCVGIFDNLIRYPISGPPKLQFLPIFAILSNFSRQKNTIIKKIATHCQEKCIRRTLVKVIKVVIFLKCLGQSWTKKSEMSMKTVKNVDEFEQICLLTTCTTKLHSYNRVTTDFLDFQQKKSKNSTHPFYYPSSPLLLCESKYTKN